MIEEVIENSESKQIDVCGDGGVLKEILKRGKGTRPYENFLSISSFFSSNI